MLNTSQQKLLLQAFIDNQVGHFDGVAGLFAHQDAARGPFADTVDDRVRREKTMAAVYAALGARGVAAEIGDAEAAALRDSGFDANEIADIQGRVRFFRDLLPRFAENGALSDSGPGGLIGPPNETFRDILGMMNAEARDVDVDQVRRLWLQALSVVLRDTGRRHQPLGSGAAEDVYRAMFGGAGQPVSMPAAPAQSPAPAPVTTTAPAGARDITISGQIAAMIETKMGVDWKMTKRGEQDVCDTAESYTCLGKILVKMIGADDVRLLAGHHPMALRQTLQSLPTRFGKAPKDWDLSFADAGAKAKAAGKPVGRNAGTIVKYLNCLMNFIKFLRGSGFSVAIDKEQIDNAKPRSKRQNPNTLRNSITESEYRTLFADEQWTGPNVIHDSTYWVPLLTRYGAGRLEEPCGLLIDDIDVDSPIPSYKIRENEMRTIKSAERRVPFHSELLRLGIREYYEAIKALGYAELFPDFRARGRKTAIGSLLSKKFTPILDRAVPDARANKKTQHSARKTLNTELRDNKIDPTIRNELLGHAQEGVNARHYMDPARDKDKRDAIETIANVTAHVPRRPIRLSPLVMRPRK